MEITRRKLSTYSLGTPGRDLGGMRGQEAAMGWKERMDLREGRVVLIKQPTLPLIMAILVLYYKNHCFTTSIHHSLRTSFLSTLTGSGKYAKINTSSNENKLEICLFPIDDSNLAHNDTHSHRLTLSLINEARATQRESTEKSSKPVKGVAKIRALNGTNIEWKRDR